MSTVHSDIETHGGVAGTSTTSWMQRRKDWLAKTYMGRYTRIRIFLDPKWREFLRKRRPYSISQFPIGPARFSFILQSDEALSLFRRFNWLSTYCLFAQQQVLAKSETELVELCTERRQYGTRHREVEYHTLVAAIKDNLTEYANLAQAKYQLHQYREPERNAHYSLLNMVEGNPVTVEGIDCSWLFKDGDLMTLDSRPPLTHLARLIQGILTVLPACVFRQLKMTNPLDRQKFLSEPKFISYDRLMALTLAISSILALIFILVPVGLLFFFATEWSKWGQFGVVIGWSVIFLFYLWLGTHAGPHESLGAAASYCALLVVFLGLS